MLESIPHPKFFFQLTIHQGSRDVEPFGPSLHLKHAFEVLDHIESEHLCHNKNYIEIMLSSIPHQKFCFYRLPTRGQAGIKLGDADTSPTYL